jgi:ABC-type Fe3+-siderophore transport system permease subunit
LKLVPLLAILLFARRRAQGFAVVDFLLVGYTAGFAFQAVEDALRQIVAGERTLGIGLGSVDAFILGDSATGEASTGGAGCRARPTST